MAEEPMFKKPKLEDEEDENTTGIYCTASIFPSDFINFFINLITQSTKE